MAARIQITNIDDVLRGLNAAQDKIEEATRYALGMAGLQVERQAKINASNGTRVRRGGRIVPPRHIGPSGSGPNVISGNLRRSISTKVMQGFGSTYIAEVSASMVYARAVEEGLPEWNGVKYPYLRPAADTLRNNGTLSRVFMTNVAMRLRGISG